jgi:acyl-CoA thioesterase FadM
MLRGKRVWQNELVRHEFLCHLRREDAAPFGLVREPAYADYLQEARIDLMNSLPPGVREEPSGPLVVVRTELELHRPLTFRERPVLVEVWVESIGPASFSLRYKVLDTEPEHHVYARARTVLAPLASDGRPRRIDADERQALERYVESAA